MASQKLQSLSQGEDQIDLKKGKHKINTQRIKTFLEQVAIFKKMEHSILNSLKSKCKALHT
jgi:hypothetical protein